MKSKYYKIAQKRVKKKKAFWNHFTVWLIVSIFFFILNMVTDHSVHWWIFPVLVWGVSVAIHCVSAYGVFHNASWEQKELDKEMRKLHKNDTSRDDYGELDLNDIPNREQYADDNFDDLKKKWDNQDYV